MKSKSTIKTPSKKCTCLSPGKGWCLKHNKRYANYLEDQVPGPKDCIICGAPAAPLSDQDLKYMAEHPEEEKWEGNWCYQCLNMNSFTNGLWIRTFDNIKKLVEKVKY
jgi:hypothetical protein